MHKLIPQVKNYDWGASGETSLVKDIYVTNVTLLDGTNEQLHKIQTEKAWAEIWAGTHPSGMARLVSGEPATTVTKGDLSFLFKVLSIEKCLSIQVHPDAQWAAQLHAKDPKNYPDPYPKPEMAIAIDFLEAFSGYVDASELRENLTRHPTFFACLQNDHPEADPKFHPGHSDHLQGLLKFLMGLAHQEVKKLLDALIGDCQNSKEKTFRDDVTLRIFSQFGYDAGILVSLALKLVRLGPMEYITLEAKVPHAYIAGNVVECMAPSDNVIRLGLTPKFKDVESFFGMFDYRADAGAKKQPTVRRYKDSDLQVLEFPNPFGEFFSLLMVTKGKPTEGNGAGQGWELEAAGPTLVFNLGEAVDVNEELVRRVHFFLADAGKLDVEAEEEDVRLFLVGKGLRLKPVGPKSH